MNPGADALEDGRHRLWNCWAARPDALLLIRADAIGDIEESAGDADLKDIAVQEAANLLDSIESGSAPINLTTPLNARFVSKLRSIVGYRPRLPAK